MAGRRRFGRVRRLPSGRWQARYSLPDGAEFPAPSTFATKTAAEQWLAGIETDIARGRHTDPRAGQQTLVEYAPVWLAARPDLKIRTRELYAWLLKKYLVPQLGQYSLTAITPGVMRSWHAAHLREDAPTPTRQAYALLRAMLNTAVADEMLLRNPCTVRGAGSAHSVERSTATIAQVNALSEAVPPRYRMLILLAAWSSARWGELVALSADRIDFEQGTMTIDRQYVQVRGGRLLLDTPKSAAGVRTVHIPPHLLPELRQHLERYTTATSPVVFPNGKDEPIRRGIFRSVWSLARTNTGLPDFRFHDLRHTGNTLAAATGASTKELMARMGHASMRAALIYHHATSDRDAAIAQALSKLALAEPEASPPQRPPLRAQGRARPRATCT